jgi:AmmeMemoRadiSam system protein A
MENARNAALHDPRFPPLHSQEADRARIEISILSEPRLLEFGSPDELLGKLVPGESGVILRVGGRMATFLPQVWSQIPDPVRFMEHLALKAGCPAEAWRSDDASVAVYSVESFQEAEAAGCET